MTINNVNGLTKLALHAPQNIRNIIQKSKGELDRGGFAGLFSLPALRHIDANRIVIRNASDEIKRIYKRGPIGSTPRDAVDNIRDSVRQRIIIGNKKVELSRNIDKYIKQKWGRIQAIGLGAISGAGLLANYLSNRKHKRAGEVS